MSRIFKDYTEKIVSWLDSFAPTYQDVLPSGVEPERSLYMIYGGSINNFADSFLMPLYVYHEKASSPSEMIDLAQHISDAIGEGGLLLQNGDAIIKIHKGSPFFQKRSDEQENTQAGYINLEITIY